MNYVIDPPPQPSVAIANNAARFPVRRIFCVGRNYADHVREMGDDPKSEPPVFFTKPADAVVESGSSIAYPKNTANLHHEVELVVAIGRDAPAGVLDVADAGALVFGYAVGLDLTRRDLQGAAKAKGLPWDTGKAFDHSAPISPIVPLAEAGELGARTLGLKVNGEIRQHGSLADLVWNVPEILHELSRLFALRAGDLVFMGTPAGVGPLHPGDRFEAVLDGIAVLQGQVTAPTV